MESSVLIALIISAFYGEIQSYGYYGEIKASVQSQFGNYSQAAVSLDSQICATIGKYVRCRGVVHGPQYYLDTSALDIFGKSVPKKAWAT